MAEESGGREEWHYGDRYYGVTLASTPDSMDLELDDLGPPPARGTVLIALCDDETQMLTLRTFTDGPLALDLVERFVHLAREQLPGRT